MGETTVTKPSELEIRVERVFDAPRAHVFSVWTDPQLIPEWWGDGTVVEEMDVRAGGGYRFRTAHGVVEGERSCSVGGLTSYLPATGVRGRIWRTPSWVP